ncbi:hypothetical protein [uncultured Aquincola sp.]|uniref:hypothetical protein n=1 Tax=uncultured Aquincola sp. TaxID=886556 RepID=UPI0032B2645F
MAATSHGDVVQRMGRTSVRLRDLGPAKTPSDNCLGGSVTTRTRAPFSHVVSAAVHHLDQQLRTGAQALTQAADDAHRWMAMGYTDTGAAAQYSFNFALAALQRFDSLALAAVADGRLTPTAADVLLSQSSTIARQLVLE